MAFKLPYFTKKAIVNKVTDLPQFRNEGLKEIGIVGRHSFGVVVKLNISFTATCQTQWLSRSY